MQKEVITHQLCPATMSHQPSHINHAHPKETFAAAPWSREIRGGLQVLKSIFWKFMTITQIYIIITKTLIRIRTPNLHCFKAGDARVNEQPGLATLHTLWLRSDQIIIIVTISVNQHLPHVDHQGTQPSGFTNGIAQPPMVRRSDFS